MISIFCLSKKELKISLSQEIIVVVFEEIHISEIFREQPLRLSCESVLYNIWCMHYIYLIWRPHLVQFLTQAIHTLTRAKGIQKFVYYSVSGPISRLNWKKQRSLEPSIFFTSNFNIIFALTFLCHPLEKGLKMRKRSSSVQWRITGPLTFSLTQTNWRCAASTELSWLKIFFASITA